MNLKPLEYKGVHFDPTQDFDTLEQQLKDQGYRNINCGDNPYCSFMKFEIDGRKIIVRGSNDGKRVHEIYYYIHPKWGNTKLIVLWRRHWWTWFDK